ncbi:solute:sodium symporter family transporter [Pseudoteredinibacter isoporae]|uniref:SSS family solute:Na+ symporter n=1 Tax=Pseudoteredinibacter isoporae TaxID=570281 RepID=A0A7X0MWU1_9GAMM|nr:solute:sodium symporter family transporter [Pseudoteredinibacter isoporae]MBB6522555.1 SSS family solute:Na+ symporter [Pseudoteredinibacter isoporae]NHO88085.1 solute:sodium symporter family transporter [Pseudoteredinibacter isoporae]NIB23584.1 solute:sodium symporter family transporter [Pseudoteredinibacter isoporae]
MSGIQYTVFFVITGLVALITYWKCRQNSRSEDSNREYFLAGNGLSWVFIAGSLTLTNISTDTLVGLNGAQAIVVAWWELGAVVGMLVLAKVLLPVYYRYNCTTTTELLEKRYNNPNIRATVSMLFLLGNLFIYLPILLFTGSLFMSNLFTVDISQMTIAILIATVGASYAIFGGLRAVAVSDTYNGIGLLIMGLVVVVLALVAIDFDFSGVPAERLTLIGDNDSDIPWHTLFTGMLFIQVFYWGTNQNITQRALAGKSLKEAQKGVYATALIRLLIIPPMVVLPGVVAYKLYGDIGDAAYGTLVKDLLPDWLAGAYAAVMLGTILSTYNSILNASAALYVCDIHEKYINPEVGVKKISIVVSLLMVILSIVMVPVYMDSKGIMALMQQLNGLLSMPILAAFITGLAFKEVDARAIIATVVFGSCLYAGFTYIWAPFHFIHMMFITLVCSVAFALVTNRIVFKQQASWRFGLT